MMSGEPTAPPLRRQPGSTVAVEERSTDPRTLEHLREIAKLDDPFEVLAYLRRFHDWEVRAILHWSGRMSGAEEPGGDEHS